MVYGCFRSPLQPHTMIIHIFEPIFWMITDYSQQELVGKIWWIEEIDAKMHKKLEQMLQLCCAILAEQMWSYLTVEFVAKFLRTIFGSLDQWLLLVGFNFEAITISRCFTQLCDSVLVLRNDSVTQSSPWIKLSVRYAYWILT